MTVTLAFLKILVVAFSFLINYLSICEVSWNFFFS